RFHEHKRSGPEGHSQGRLQPYDAAMRRWVWPIILVGIVGSVVGIVVASSGAGGPGPTGVRPTRAINATHAGLLPMTTTALPSLTSDEFRRLVTQLRGTPVVLNVWGSWCGPCREEGPRLADAA